MKKNLWTPIKIRGMELKNRMVVSPMQQFRAKEGKIGDWHLVHIGSRAVGGAGLIVAEGTAILPNGRCTTSDTGLWDLDQAEAWRKIVGFVHDQNCKISIQLVHFGGKGSRKHPKEGFDFISEKEGGWDTVSSTAISPIKGAPVPRELTKSEIRELQGAFVTSAKLAVEAGFDSIELHAAHGYLFHQFLSELINHRADEYGGTFENRSRFLIETVRAVRDAIPEEMPLMVRLSAVDFVNGPKAWKMEDTVRLSKALKDCGVDIITASAGGFVFLDKAKVYPGYQLPYAEDIKKSTGIVTGAVGMITEKQQANDIIANEQADLVFMARELLRNPYFPNSTAVEFDMAHQIPFEYKRAYV